jgi:starvation-inducible outer membrane lipoprotein
MLSRALIGALALAGCAAPPQSLTSEVANAQPNCVWLCFVTVAVVEGNTGDGGLTTAVGAASTNTRAPVRTTTLTDQSSGLPLTSQY